MGPLKPCYVCGISHRSGVLLISIFYIILCLTLMAFCLREYTMHSEYGLARDHEPHRKIGTDDEDLYFYLGLFCLIHLFFSLLLWHGAVKKSRNRCLIWFVVTSIETSFLFVRVLFYDVMHYRFQVGLLFINMYNLWVVWAFIEDIFDELVHRPLDVTSQTHPTTTTQVLDGNTSPKKKFPITKDSKVSSGSSSSIDILSLII